MSDLLRRAYERGFIAGRQKQMQSSVDKAVNRLAAPPEPVAFYNFQTHQMRWAKPTVYAEIVAVDVPELPLYAAPPQPIEQLKAERDAAVVALEHQRQFYDRYMPTDAAPKDRLREVEAERDAAVRELELATAERNRAHRACEQISVRLHAAMAERDALKAQRQPLTGKAIIAAYDNMELSGKLSAFIEGARYAEQAHNIGGDK